MMHSSKDFLDRFIEDNDEVLSRCLSPETFGAELDNEENDVPLQDMYNRGLVLTQKGRERENLNLEGARWDATGYIPSMEEGIEMGARPIPKTVLLELESPEEKELLLSQQRRGLFL